MKTPLERNPAIRRARAPPATPSPVVVPDANHSNKTEGLSPFWEGDTMSFHDFHSKLVSDQDANLLFTALRKLSLLDDPRQMAQGEEEPGPGWIVWGDAGTVTGPALARS